MTEADLKREADKLFQRLGLRVGSESLDFFLGESVYLSDWKGQFSHPPHDCNGLTWKSMSLAKEMSGSMDSVSTSPLSQEGRYDDQDHYGECGLCGRPVESEDTGCVALQQVFHNGCFKCNKCGTVLSGTSFYVLGGRILCERDYQLSLDRCCVCKQAIKEKIIKAVGCTFHPVCFRCNTCGMCLDGVPFATDYSNKVYCEKDFHKVYAPRCAICHDPIIPSPGKANTRRVIAMNLSFHVGCYCCADCGVSLLGEGECHPKGDTPLCLSCNKQRADHLTN